MSFKIVITDNKTGKVLVDENKAKAIIGAYVDGERTGCMGFTRCNPADMLATINGAEDVIEKLLNKDAMLKALYTLAKGFLLEDDNGNGDEPDDFANDEDVIKDIDLPEESQKLLRDIFKR